jgi:hypothetical protein
MFVQQGDLNSREPLMSHPLLSYSPAQARTAAEWCVRTQFEQLTVRDELIGANARGCAAKRRFRGPRRRGPHLGGIEGSSLFAKGKWMRAGDGIGWGGWALGVGVRTDDALLLATDCALLQDGVSVAEPAQSHRCSDGRGLVDAPSRRLQRGSA